MRRRMLVQKAVTIAAVPLLGALLLTVATPGMASARPAAKSHAPRPNAQTATKSAAGTYAYYDNLGDTDEALTLDTDGEALFATGCYGSWVQDGKIFSMDIIGDCGGNTWIFSGTIGKKGVASAAKPGAVNFAGEAGTWYAIKGAPTEPASGGPLLTHQAAAGRPLIAKAGGDYAFYDAAGDSNIPLTLTTSGGSLTLNVSGTLCTGLWVQSGKDIALDLNASGCSHFVMAAPVSAKGLATKKKPGQINYNAEGTETWYAVKT